MSGLEGDDRARIPSRAVAPPRDDAELVRRLAAGDVEALSEIADWLWDSVAAYAYRIVEDQDTAVDIAQDALVRLWEGRARTPPRSVRAFLFRIARNLALDHVKTRHTRRRLLDRHAPSRNRSAAAPDELLEREHVSVRVQRAIQDLPERRREVFVLAYLRGLSYAEIGEVMGTSPKTVSNQMSAALAQLRKTLRPLLDDRARDRDRTRRERKGHDGR